MKMDAAAVPLLHTLLVLMIFPSAAPASCPRPCSCPQPSELHCTFRSLSVIPASISKNVERMNLGFNSIKITDKSLAGLRKLELLMIHGNDIHSLPDGAFKDLISLQMLKMSYNKLKELNRRALRGLSSLARLHLDHNQLEFIHPDAFQGLTSLRLLQLEGNQLQQLHPATFSTFTIMGQFHVSTLKHLYLSDNGLTTLPSTLVTTMPQLENLYLHGNPWTCDCNLKWLQDWNQTFPGVIKCKKDRNLPGGQVCPACSSPRHLQKKELHAADSMVCSSPVISSAHRTSAPEDTESEVKTVDTFREPFGNITLEMSDEHGNEANLGCSIGEPREIAKINWEQISQLQLESNITLSVDLDCAVDREKYERLWRLIAYYSNVPAHLQRGIMLRKEPHPTYEYRQDSDKDALYYTGIKVNVMAQPEWLMQASADLQLNRLQSSAQNVKLILSLDLSQTVNVEQMQRQKRNWVWIESNNTTRKVWAAVLGGPIRMRCKVQSSEQAVIYWTLPDGSRVRAPHSGPDKRLSVSPDGQLDIKSVTHTDAGIYYCTAKVRGDLAVMPFYLTVQENSTPPPGEEALISPPQVFAGNPISLPCEASGSPDAEINWILPSNSIVSFHNKSSRAVVYSNGTLNIPQAHLSDGGHYKCIAINQHGVDALATQITVLRHKVLIRPLRKFPARPQSASGASTEIKVLSEDVQEASGDIEVNQEASPIKPQNPARRIPAVLAPGRRGGHPSRSTWRRPTMLKKPTGSQVDVKKPSVDSRRRINMSQKKIDKEKWAVILAKIRDKNGQNTVTPLPVQPTTKRGLIKPTTQSQETIEGSSDGVTVVGKDSQRYLTTPDTPVTQTAQANADNHATQNQRRYDTSTGYDPALMEHDTTPNGQHVYTKYATTQPNIMQTHTATQSRNLDEYTTSSSLFTLPQTTSVPPHAVTVWQLHTNSERNSTFSPSEKHSADTDVNKVEEADRSGIFESSEKTEKPTVVASAGNDKELLWSGSQIIPSLRPEESEKSQDESGKYLGETATPQLHTQDWDKSVHDLSSKVQVLTTAAASTTRKPAAKTTARLKHSRRKNGGRKKRPGKRKQKLDKPPKSPAPTSENANSKRAQATASTELKIEPLEVTTARFNTTVPFTSSQGASSGRVSHKENIVSMHDHKPATKPPSQPALTPENKDSLQHPAKPLVKNTSVAPLFPTAFPEEVHGTKSFQRDLGISETSTLTVAFNELTSPIQQIVTGSTFSPYPPLETQQPSVTANQGGLDPNWKDSSLSIPTTTVQTDGNQSQSNHQFGSPEKSGEATPPPTTSPAYPSETTLATLTTGFTSHDLILTPSLLLEDDLETTTEKPNGSESHYDNSSRNATTSNESKANQHLQETTNTVDVDTPTLSTGTTSSPKATSSKFEDKKITSTDSHSLVTTTEAAQTIRVNNSEEHQIKDMTNTSENHPATQSPADAVTSKHPKQTREEQFSQNTTSAPVITTIQTNTFTGRLLTSPQVVTRLQQLPGRGYTLAEKPRITKSNSLRFMVKAETDALLPCEAMGEPKPFLSWTRVDSGAVIVRNTRVHRFEVHLNGSLIIRNTQHTDEGQYLCTVQNQYGTDKMLVNLVVLSQHPMVLQPRNREIKVQLGGRVDLDCQVEGHPVPRVTWMLPNGIPLTAAPSGDPLHQRLTVLRNGTFQISQVISTDQGVYKCIGSSTVGSDIVSVHLHVLTTQPVIEQMNYENITFPEGTTAYIHCAATGSPPPVIHWKTPKGIQLTASQFFTAQNLGVFPNGTLVIQGLRPGNAGRYECTASNTVGYSKRTVLLNTKKNLPPFSKSRITSSSPQSTDVIYGSTLLLNCVAKGQPNPWIIWRTPSRKLADAQYSFDPRIKVFHNGSIIIHHVTDTDHGDYLCVARNKMGDDYVVLRVNVLKKPAKIEQKQQRSKQEVIYGGDLKVDCVASGLPNPEISWALPDGTMINPVKQREHVSGGRSRRYLVFDNGTLYFNDVGMPEEGDYTCYAENQLGKDEMKVRVKVKASTSPPQIQNKDYEVVRVSYGETGTLGCKAKGDPLPVITWISPTNKIISPAVQKYQVLDDGMLVVQKVQRFDGGNYTCMAKNNAGQDYKVIKLEVVVTPPRIIGSKETSSVITAVQKQRTLLDCVAEGTPMPRIMWVLPGNMILPAPYNSNRMTVHQNGTLEIRSSKRTDSGLLACMARNEGGEAKMTVYLEVKEDVNKPKVRGPRTESRSLTVGITMTLNCTFEGPEQPHITWILPSGTPLRSGTRFSKFFHRSDGSLMISNPSVGEAGLYRCLGRHSGGLVERSVSLSPGKKPEIINRYSSPVNIMNGEKLLLHCLTSGDAVRLTWTLPNGVILNRPQRAGRYSVLSNGTLAIQQASVYDRGSYICRAANEYGSSLLSVSATVIAYPARITNGPPSVTYAKHGVAVQLNCIATGIPKVEVAWETPDKTRLAVSAQPRLFGNKYLHPQGSLIIQNPSQRDSGVYRCTAKNAIGVDSKTTFLNVF